MFILGLWCGIAAVKSVYALAMKPLLEFKATSPRREARLEVVFSKVILTKLSSDNLHIEQAVLVPFQKLVKTFTLT